MAGRGASDISSLNSGKFSAKFKSSVLLKALFIDGKLWPKLKGGGDAVKTALVPPRGGGLVLRDGISKDR